MLSIQSDCIKREILIVTGGFADFEPERQHCAISEFTRLSRSSEDNVYRVPFSGGEEAVFVKTKYRSRITIWYMAMLREEYAGDLNDNR